MRERITFKQADDIAINLASMLRNRFAGKRRPVRIMAADAQSLPLCFMIANYMTMCETRTAGSIEAPDAVVKAQIRNEDECVALELSYPNSAICIGIKRIEDTPMQWPWEEEPMVTDIGAAIPNWLNHFNVTVPDVVLETLVECAPLVFNNILNKDDPIEALTFLEKPERKTEFYKQYTEVVDIVNLCPVCLSPYTLMVRFIYVSKKTNVIGIPQYFRQAGGRIMSPHRYGELVATPFSELFNNEDNNKGIAGFGLHVTLSAAPCLEAHAKLGDTVLPYDPMRQGSVPVFWQVEGDADEEVRELLNMFYDL